MERLNELYRSLDDCGVLFFDEKLHFTDALVIEVDGTYGLFVDHSQLQTLSEELVSVAHESGHIFTGSLHNLENRHNLVMQDECRANRWAIKKLLPFDEIKSAMHLGYTTSFELSEYFNLTEPFVQMALDYYISAQGLSFCAPKVDTHSTYTSPAPKEEPVPEKDILFSVFNGSQELTPEMYAEVQSFADHIAKVKQTP